MKIQAKHIKSAAFLLLALSTLNLQPSTAHAQGTAFNYAGQLQNNGSPASGTYNFAFTLFATNTSGVAIAGPVTNSAVTVTNGLFTVLVDFGSGVFTGTSNWLEMAVETNGGSSFTTLSPRQELTPTPYAIYAESAGGLPGLVVQPNAAGAPNVIGGSSENSVSGGVVGATIGGGGAVNFSGSTYSNSVTANFGTVGGGAQNTVGGSWAAVGGGYGNTASAPGSFIGGGGSDGFDFFGNQIQNTASAATIGGGLGNQIQTYGNYAFIGGGYFNVINGYAATVGGGNENTAYGSSYATVGGGYGNNANGHSATVSGGYLNNANGIGSFIGGGGYDGTTQAGNTVQDNAATIGGGLGNTIQSGAPYAFIGGGYNNIASHEYATVGGGYNNYANGTRTTVGGGGDNITSHEYATVGGGYNNYAVSADTTVGGGYQNTASADYATVSGGYSNTASGQFSFAAGQRGQALHQGAFVWADSQNAPFASTANDQFNVRAQGGVNFMTSGAGMTVDGQPVAQNYGTAISSAPYTITKPGSYYLTTNLTASSGDAIDIEASGVTLDLNGFTISSTAASATGSGIFLTGTNRNITIANGFIQGGVTNNGSGVYGGGGFASGVYYSGNQPVNVLVSRVSISGCLDDGIYLNTGDSTVVESCTVRTVGSDGIVASTVKSCSAIDCGDNGIYGDQVSDCNGQSTGSTGIYASYTAQNCYGQGSSGGDGLDAVTALNCYGVSGGSGDGLVATIAQNCYGQSSFGLGYGIYAYQIAIGCYGFSSDGTGLYAFIANVCHGATFDGTALNAIHNVNSY